MPSVIDIHESLMSLLLMILLLRMFTMFSFLFLLVVRQRQMLGSVVVMLSLFFFLVVRQRYMLLVWTVFICSIMLLKFKEGFLSSGISFSQNRSRGGTSRASNSGEKYNSPADSFEQF